MVTPPRPPLAARGACLYPIVNSHVMSAPVALDQAARMIADAARTADWAVNCEVKTKGRGRRPLDTEELCELVQAVVDIWTAELEAS